MAGQTARMAPTSVTESTGPVLWDEIACGRSTLPTQLWITHPDRATSSELLDGTGAMAPVPSSNFTAGGRT